jgi:hypothetical protein
MGVGQAFFFFVVESPKDGKEPHEIPIMWEFLDVFSAMFSGLPQEPEIELCIDYILGTMPISKGP